jgi:uncharacterized protein (DUF885 family)
VPQEGFLTLRQIDAAILQVNVCLAAKDPAIGFVDADRTLDQLVAQMGRFKVDIKQDLVESCLWSANMLAEEKKFWHPQGRSFKSFLDDIIVDSRYRFEPFDNRLVLKRWK